MANRPPRSWIEVSEPREVIPLYRRGPFETAPRAAYIEIDLETGKVGTAVDAPGGGVPARVWHGLVQRVEVHPAVLRWELEAFLESPEFKEALTVVLNEARVYFDGKNRVGELTDRGLDALEKIASMADELPHAAVWTPEEWTHFALWVDYDTGLTYLGETLITPDTLDELITENPEVVDDGVINVIPGFHSFLEAIAEENAAILKRLED